MLFQQKVKTDEIVKSVTLLTIGLGLAAATMYSALAPKSQPSNDVSSWVVMALFCAVFIDLSLLALRRDLAMRSANIGPDPKGFYSRLTSYFLVKDVISSVVFLLVIGGVFFIVVASGGKTMMVTKAFIAQLSVYGAYLLVRIPLGYVVRNYGNVSAGRRGHTKWTSGYEVSSNAVTLDLKIISRKPLGSVRISFDEIDDLRAMTPAEALAYERAQISSHLSLTVQESTDLIAFSQGKIPRPNLFVAITSFGTALFIHGPHLLYLITVNCSDVSDLLNAYAAYRHRGERSA